MITFKSLNFNIDDTFNYNNLIKEYEDVGAKIRMYNSANIECTFLFFYNPFIYYEMEEL